MRLTALLIQQGPVTRPADDRTRAEVLALLTGTLDLEDAGVRVEAGKTCAGCEGRARPRVLNSTPRPGA